jgi:RNA polymerase sigma factor (sigma-70 family)
MPDMDDSKQPKEYLPTRASLLSRLRNAEDSKSWQEFFDTYWDLIYGVAIKSGLTPTEAEDVLQETLISTAKYLKDFQYDSSRSFKAWLLKIARTRIANQYGFRKRLPGSSGLPKDKNETDRTATVERLPDSHYDLAEHWDDEWREHIQKAVLKRIRNSVKPKHYQIFDAYVIKGWSVEKVAATLGVTTDLVYQVKSRLAAAIEKEVSRLETRGI